MIINYLIENDKTYQIYHFSIVLDQATGTSMLDHKFNQICGKTLNLENMTHKHTKGKATG